MREINHQRAQILIQSFIGGVINDPDEADLKAHLKDCAECQVYLRQMNALETGLRRAMHAKWDNVQPAIRISERAVKKARTYTMLKKNLNFASAGIALVAIVLLIAFAMTLLPEREAQPGGEISGDLPTETAQTAISTEVVELVTEVPTPAPPIDAIQTYTDPAGQYRLNVPAGWIAGGEEGSFMGEDGVLRTGYMPEMAFMNSVHRVCEKLANTPQGPGRQIQLSPLPTADACTLIPLPKMSMDRVTLVVENPQDEPEQRYFFVETDQGHFEDIYASLEILNPPAEREAFPYPTGPMRPEDEAFWGETGEIPEELTVEEYQVSEASEASPIGFEFRERIPAEVFQKREEWRDGYLEERLAVNNALLEPFGYSLKATEGEEMELYELYRAEELILGEINEFWRLSVNASGTDFALVAGVMNNPYKLVRMNSIEEWDMGVSLYRPPVFFGDDLLHVGWDGERSQALVLKGDEQIYAFASQFMVDMPVKGFWSWEEHWLLEVDGFLIQDGENLNETLGYEEIFGWQLLNDKPFYYFRKGPQVGISYDGQVLPLHYDDIIHYRCCEPAMFNNGGNEDMAWFYGLRDGTWYYTEMGVYGEDGE